MTTIHTTARQQPNETAARVDVDAVARQQGSLTERREITDETAVTIAAWYQSPGSVGRHLATLASGLPVDLDDLLRDIHNTRAEVTDNFERACLDCLATWAINHASRED